MSGVLALNKKRTVRGPINEADKCTIVSIYPKEIKEKKLTITPGVFIIPAGTLEKPSVLTVGPSSWWRDMDEDQPLLEIPNSSVQIAESIVKDYANGLIGCNMSTAMPGIFWLMGSYTSDQVLKNFKTELERARVKQVEYFQALIRMADSLWARMPGNPVVISDDMRLACEQIGVQGKEWMNHITMVENIKCAACGMPRNPEYPICPSCHNIIDRPLAEKLGIVITDKK